MDDFFLFTIEEATFFPFLKNPAICFLRCKESLGKSALLTFWEIFLPPLEEPCAAVEAAVVVEVDAVTTVEDDDDELFIDVSAISY